jgi:hypothetical protein
LRSSVVSTSKPRSRLIIPSLLLMLDELISIRQHGCMIYDHEDRMGNLDWTLDT